MSTEESNTPIVFISYSHDTPEHKRWVLDLAGELRKKGIEVMIDAWDLRPGDDVPKYMERGVRDSNRVLMICTEKYVAKANDGVGGVGYEAMIVTSELVQDLGTAKFVPIIRQTANSPTVPTSVATRLYINLSDDKKINSEMEKLLRDLHSVPPEKPELGPSPFIKVPESPSSDNNSPLSPKTEAAPESTLSEPIDFYKRALHLAQQGDILNWRRVISVARQFVTPALKTWFAKYGSMHPGDIKTLNEQSMEGLVAFAPLTAIALGGVASGAPKFVNQIGLLEDILNPVEWQRGGFVVRVELPETGAFIYQALCGAMCLHISNLRAAVELARCNTLDRKTGKTLPLWQRHDIVGWPESLGKTATNAWEVACDLANRLPWVSDAFGDTTDYQVALYAYYLSLTLVEFTEHVRAGKDIPEDPQAAHWWPDVPVFFELADEAIKRRGYHLVSNENSAFRSWLVELKVDQNDLRRQWPKWTGIQSKIFASESRFSFRGIAFDRLLYDMLGN